MRRTRIKICGLKQADMAAYACASGADAIGLVFYPPSPRYIEPAQAVTVAAAVTPFVSRVGLFMDPDPDWVRHVMASVGLDCLQFHGSESAHFCAGFGLPYMKSVPMADTPDLAEYARTYSDATAFLLDSNATGEAGGSGQTFDWRADAVIAGRPTILAGGLNAANVATAIGSVRPYAVDVSSGVERERGIKDKALIDAFIARVRQQDNTQDFDWNHE